MLAKLNIVLSAGLLAIGIAACGSSGSSSSTSGGGASSSAATTSGASGYGATTSAASGSATSTSGAGALSAEAQSAATGDIPDNQVYLSYTNASAGYAIKYPEGWTLKGGGSSVTFSDKNNIIHIAVEKGTAPTSATVAADLQRQKRQTPTLSFTPPKEVTLKSGPAIKATYTTESAPNPVTGKTVVLVVDRYAVSKAGKRATIDLATAKGVDTVDAYRMIANSFQWQ